MAPHRAVALYTFSMEQVQSCTIKLLKDAKSITAPKRWYPGCNLWDPCGVSGPSHAGHESMRSCLQTVATSTSLHLLRYCLTINVHIELFHSINVHSLSLKRFLDPLWTACSPTPPPLPPPPPPSLDTSNNIYPLGQWSLPPGHDEIAHCTPQDSAGLDHPLKQTNYVIHRGNSP